MIFLVLRAGAKSVAHATVRPDTKRGGGLCYLTVSCTKEGSQAHPPIPTLVATSVGPFTSPMPVKTSTAYHIF